MEIKDRLALAAIHMREANIGLAVKSVFSSNPFGANEYRGMESLTGDGVDYWNEVMGNASALHFSGGSCQSYAKAYFDCPPLSGIINRKAQSFTNGVSYIINTKGKGKEREAKGDIATKISSLMANPNWLQSGDEFEAQNYINTQLFGFCVVLFYNKPFGMPNYYAKEMWNIPSHMITINELPGIFYKGNKSGIKSIKLDYGGESIDLPLESIAFIRDIMPSFTSVFIPDSRVKTLVMPVNNIIGAYESRNMLINSRGALGMLTNQTSDASSFIPLKDSEKKELYRNFKKLYGLRKNQVDVIITSSNLKWQSMVQPTKDLMLFEEIQDDGNRICDAYMFPPELFAKMNGGTTFSNIATATRNLYQDAIMPEAKNIYSQWNKIFDTAKNGLELGREYKGLPALQGANKEEAEANLRTTQGMQIAFRNNIVTRNQWIIKLGYEPVEDGDVYYSDIKHLLDPPKNIEDDHVEDNINPQEGNDGTPGQQA